MTQSTGPVGLTGAHASGDLIMAKPDWHGRWQPCYVEWATRYQVCCKPARGGRPFVVKLGKRGQVKPLHGLRLIEVQAELAGLRGAAMLVTAPAAFKPIVRLDRVATLPQRAVAFPEQRVLSDAFRDFVREHVCLDCVELYRPVEAHHEGPQVMGGKTHDPLCVPLCAGLDGCHRHYEDKLHFRGRSREESLALMQEAQRMLLVSWHVRLMELLAPPALHELNVADHLLFGVLSEGEVGNA